LQSDPAYICLVITMSISTALAPLEMHHMPRDQHLDLQLFASSVFGPVWFIAASNENAANTMANHLHVNVSSAHCSSAALHAARIMMCRTHACNVGLLTVWSGHVITSRLLISLLALSDAMCGAELRRIDGETACSW
jgi:hypothetical protein